MPPTRQTLSKWVGAAHDKEVEEIASLLTEQCSFPGGGRLSLSADIWTSDETIPIVPSTARLSAQKIGSTVMFHLD